MDADYEIFEIVAVIRDFWLFDAESYQRRYFTSDGQPLAPGYYVVKWPEHIRARRFNEHAMFHGPFKLRKEAQAARDWMQKQWQCVLSISSRISSIAVPNFSRRAVKETASLELLPVDGATAKHTACGRKPRITEASPSDYWETVKVAVR